MLPLSEKRLRANRANATRSTGPVTVDGKQRAARNAMRHGLLANQILIGHESADNFKQLCEIFTAKFQPVDEFEFNMIEELAASYWRLRRAWCMEKEMLTSSMKKKSGGQMTRITEAFTDLAREPQLALLHRYEARLHHMHQRALHNLLLLRQLQPAPTGPVLEPPAPTLLATPMIESPATARVPNEPITLLPCNESDVDSGAEPAPREFQPDGSAPASGSGPTAPSGLLAPPAGVAEDENDHLPNEPKTTFICNEIRHGIAPSPREQAHQAPPPPPPHE